jgi:hypothetical protein
VSGCRVGRWVVRPLRSRRLVQEPLLCRGLAGRPFCGRRPSVVLAWVVRGRPDRCRSLCPRCLAALRRAAGEFEDSDCPFCYAGVFRVECPQKGETK